MKKSPHRPTVARIDLAAIAYNIQQITKHIPNESKKWAVVKADAYGHGAVEVANFIEPIVDGFCVSNIDEALELREAGIAKAILILGVSEISAIELAIVHQIACTVSSMEWVENLLAIHPNLMGLKVHLKIDTGMGRIGFRDASEAEQAIRNLQAAGAEIEGIFTHFATADEENQEQFQQQVCRFEAVLAALPTDGLLVHSSNSAATLWHPTTILNAVRMGDMMYGLNPSGNSLKLPFELKPALSLESELVQVKKLNKGDTVGYGATYLLDEEQWIGTIPIGYADGWTRDMQGFSVLIDGAICPIVGRVSMDQITVQLPHRYPITTKVTLIGVNGQKEITATDVAEKRGTINYEVVCLISDRVPRIYSKQ
ncbi:Alanine racemase [Streptococcus sp. DD10]|uniref:alanine racemase n=1 Tax=Streptococcus sp. DD10 TaxID=1777878 RepID=UPI000797D721|nr:alanine racemase [Streptococcus sp. DD10]KXT74625.1 Alanine racemase [Streptococcus sp. DD10]